jgi:pyruvate dehydrogenase E1 component beta subunit
VLYLDHYGLYKKTGPVPEEDYVVPIGKADIKRPGEDVTIVSYSIMMPKVMAAAEQLSKDGISAEVVDLRSLVPMDEEALLNSVKKTGRLVIAHEAMKRGGVGGEVAARVAEKGFKYLKTPILRIGAKSIPLPRITARLEAAIIPQVADVVAGVKSVM